VSDDALWLRLRDEAREKAEREPALSSLYYSILSAPSFEDALVARLASRLSGGALARGVVVNALVEAIKADPSIEVAARADMTAVLERDPACPGLLEPFLYFKGFAAIQSHRLAHWLWTHDKRNMALYIQSRSSEEFQTDIHPAASIGKGVFLDHATGFVAGETVVIEDNVSLFHGVTLGGTGIEKGERHPKIRSGVLIGAGAQLLGNIEIGENSVIAAGSLVMQSVPPSSTAVGVPARIIKGVRSANPAKTMDQRLAEAAYEAFTYVI
jgi:serine O-acetyltransferase